MDIRTTRYFLTVVDAGSISAASRMLHVAQPSLSRQLRQLERDLRVDLFVRHRGRLHLSPAGRRLLPIARDLVARSDQAVDMMRTLAAGKEAWLTVTSTITTINDVLAPVAATSRKAVLNLVQAATAEVAEAVESGKSDLGFSSHPGATDLETELVARFPLHAQVSSDHAWAEQTNVTLEELVRQPLIVPTVGFAARRVFDDYVGRLPEPVRHPRIQEMDLPRAAQALAARNQGVAVVSGEPHFDLHGVTITGAVGERLELPLFALWNRTHYSAALIRECVQEVRQYCASIFPNVDPR